ncbi:UBIQUITIN-40S ribosomal protein S31 [Anaeramoeba ignava]|uniref:UBIQUITIN-40S ribosomal protein S31 n=1 Tax=Anaeramoeba ignava TaxID=1746090 RepID=A0A9Q0LWP9_ANAIG|nr:UBIQUITIN-40S ribosomal protein S31 [Anaeramoeba ignava]
MKIFVKTLTGKQFAFDVSPQDTILNLKKELEQSQGIPFSQQKFILAGNTLQDDQTFQDYRIQEKTTIHLVLTRGGDNANPNEPDAIPTKNSFNQNYQVVSQPSQKKACNIL